MGMDELVESDERTEAVEKASYGLGYRLLAFGLLIDVAYRSFRFGEAAWDLMGLVIVSGAVLAAYQHRHHILGRRWLRAVAFAVGVSTVAAVLLFAALKR